MIQRLAAARREIIRAKVVSRSHAAQGQFRRHAQLCPGCGGLPHVVKYAFHISGHIACDSRSRSEIVVPVRDASGALIAVFDVDATEPAAFDATDAQALERLMAKVFAAG